MSKTYYQSLDLWRGLACLWVVMMHACAPALATQFPNLKHNPLYAVSLYGFLGVQMFFVISGYCIVQAAASAMRKDSPFKTFVRARVRRIYPPYIVAAILSILLSAAAGYLVAKGVFKGSSLASADVLHQGPLYFFAQATLTQFVFHKDPVLVPFWTLCYEAAFYLIVGLFLLIPKARITERLMLNGLHTLTFASLVYLIAVPFHHFYPLDLWPVFGLGGMVYDILKHPESKLPKAFFGVAAALFLVFGFLHEHIGQEGDTLMSSRLMFFVGLASASVLLLLNRFDDKIAQTKALQPFFALGRISYSLYLTNFLALGFLAQIQKRLHISQALFTPFFILSVLLAIAFGYVFYRFFEKPYLNHRKPLSVEEGRAPAPEVAAVSS
ncbi:MAG: putative acyltransferase [Capsulimonas sp.]|nr:putative acyltransferase [Capsulimonas sp.]